MVKTVTAAALLLTALNAPAVAWEDTDFVCDNEIGIRFDAGGQNPVAVDVDGNTVAPLRECSAGPAPCFRFEEREFQYNLFWLQMEPGGEFARCPAVVGF